MKEVVSCFLPCRKGSERVPRKNIKSFAGNTFGLIEVKLKQLLNSRCIDEIVLSTNDEEILNYAHSLKQRRIRLHQREEALSSNTTSTDQLVAHALSLIPKGHILWTHVTSPFITGERYDNIISCYRDQLERGYDSLMTTTPLQNFLWQDNKPINYDRVAEKWPRTQTIKPVHEVNSGAFLTSSSIYADHEDRIGLRPYLYELDKLASHDIDWREDFLIAECMVEKRLVAL
jgi:CMP-N-acetylneuraminic acid synthetase